MQDLVSSPTFQNRVRLANLTATNELGKIRLKSYHGWQCKTLRGVLLCVADRLPSLFSSVCGWWWSQWFCWGVRWPEGRHRPRPIPRVRTRPTKKPTSRTFCLACLIWTSSNGILQHAEREKEAKQNVITGWERPPDSDVCFYSPTSWGRARPTWLRATFWGFSFRLFICIIQSLKRNTANYPALLLW